LTQKNPSEFQEKFELIDELLSRINMGFEEGMTREEREALDIERQSLVLRAGWNSMSIEELRALLQSS
jgi:hypothetical protein